MPIIMRLARLILAITVYSDCNIEAAKILAVFPTPSISHQVVFRPLVHELAKRGHEVIIVTTDPVFPKGGAPKNLTEIDVHDMSYKMWEDFLKTSTGNQNDLYTQMKVGIELIGRIFVRQMETDEVQKVLKEGNFDLLFVEALSRPALALTHILKAPTIQVSSFGAMLGNFECMGAAVHPIIYPSMFRQKLVNLTFWEKVSELRSQFTYNNLYDSLVEFDNQMARKVFGDDVPSVTELCNNVDMMFLNVRPIFDSNRPVPPNVVYLGGLHQNPIKELPNNWDLEEVEYMQKPNNFSDCQVDSKVFRLKKAICGLKQSSRT